jgi:hypothetical protein
MKLLFWSAAAFIAHLLVGGGTFALTASQAQIRDASTVIAKVHYRHRRHSGAPYRNWCAYNCYAVPSGTLPPLGAYRYSQYRYDQDIPARYRWDGDASPIDNAFALVYPYTAEPIMRIP